MKLNKLKFNLYILLIIFTSFAKGVKVSESILEALPEQYYRIFEQQQLFKAPLNTILSWDNTVNVMTHYIEENSKNLLGQKDTAIIKGLVAVLSIHNTLIEIIRIAYLNKVFSNIEAPATLRLFEQLNNLSKNTALINNKKELEKLRTGKTTLEKKVRAIAALEMLEGYVQRAIAKTQQAFLNKLYNVNKISG